VTATDLDELVQRALPDRRLVRARPIGGDRGVFSLVHQVELDEGEPATVVIKRPHPGPNGASAAASGAYRREAVAYQRVLPATPVAAPRCHLVDLDGDRASFVLQDLTDHRSVDQLRGLSGSDAAAVVDELAALHRHWEHAGRLDGLEVRRSTPAGFDPELLARGLDVIGRHWQVDVGPGARRSLARLLERRSELVGAFAAAAPRTLCHGDPRADNVAFTPTGRAVLFDWQQLGVSAAQADLAWLAATSLDPEVRREVERDLVARHAAALGHEVADAWDRYRSGMVLPGLAVLLLAQRDLTSARAERLVATSLRRIALAVEDLEVADLAC
jgi:aminoglycoside phosphotransferase (APT) family kinase protein